MVNVTINIAYMDPMGYSIITLNNWLINPVMTKLNLGETPDSGTCDHQAEKPTVSVDGMLPRLIPHVCSKATMIP